ncbi:hypothetical protein K492DRAFT_192778 [Lichtheimia hyalospora FSU 10163]|nr:hypothetical protein K492DRAFT_192778 [Lichtheimia hyalospora FSU 10163]
MSFWTKSFQGCLGWNGLWNTLSDLDCNLPHDLLPYTSYIQGNDIRSLQIHRRQTAKSNVLCFLINKGCCSIRQVHLSWEFDLYGLVQLTGDSITTMTLSHLHTLMPSTVLDIVFRFCPNLIDIEYHVTSKDMAYGAWSFPIKHKHLQSIDLRFGGRVDFPLEQLLPQLPALRRISLSPRNFAMPSRVLQLLYQYAPQLDSIHFCDWSPSDTDQFMLTVDVHHSASSRVLWLLQQTHASLEALGLRFIVKSTAVTMACLLALDFPHLRKLRLCFCNGLPCRQQDIARVLDQCPCLEEFGLGGVSLSTKELVVAIASLNKLKVLHLTRLRHATTETTLCALFDTMTSRHQLTMLHLERLTHVTGDVLDMVCARFTDLRVLHIKRCLGITDNALRHLADQLKKSALKELVLSTGFPISDSAMQYAREALGHRVKLMDASMQVDDSDTSSDNDFD